MRTGTTRSLKAVVWLLAVSLGSTSLIADSISCPPDASGEGRATTYSPLDPVACSLPIHAGYSVAISDARFENSARCGECLLITGPAGSVVATITDRCFSCGENDLDVNPATWDVIADQEAGIVDVSWQRVACPVSGNVLFGFQNSNPFYLKIQAQEHRYGTSTMAYQSDSSWIAMERTADNHFEATGVPNIQQVVVRLTATTGESIEATLGDPFQTALIDSGAQFTPCAAEIFSDRFEPLPE